MFAIARCRLPGLTARRSYATLGNLPSEPVSVKPSRSEVSMGSLDSRNLEIAIRRLHQDGLVVVEDVVPHHLLDHLNTKMVSDARYLQGLGEKGPFNYNQGNLQQDAPPVGEFFHPAIFTSMHHSPSPLVL